jgi:hypothetical protein
MGPAWLALLRPIVGREAKKFITERMERAEPLIVAGMRSKRFEPPHVTVAIASRDAIFRLWKAVVGSGTVADLVRDHQDQDVVPKVETKLANETPVTLERIVAVTREAVIEETFP